MSEIQVKPEFSDDDLDVYFKRQGKMSQDFKDFKKKYLSKDNNTKKALKAQQSTLDSYLKFATLHDEIDMMSYSSQYYWVIFILRRVVFLTVCVYTNDSYWQVAVYTVCSMISGAYMAAVFPFDELRKNRLENFNEVIVFSCGVF